MMEFQWLIIIFIYLNVQFVIYEDIETPNIYDLLHNKCYNLKIVIFGYWWIYTNTGIAVFCKTFTSNIEKIDVFYNC
jgi:flavin-dependent dehydrogenase